MLVLGARAALQGQVQRAVLALCKHGLMGLQARYSMRPGRPAELKVSTRYCCLAGRR